MPAHPLRPWEYALGVGRRVLLRRGHRHFRVIGHAAAVLSPITTPAGQRGNQLLVQVTLGERRAQDLLHSRPLTSTAPHHRRSPLCWTSTAWPTCRVPTPTSRRARRRQPGTACRSRSSERPVRAPVTPSSKNDACRRKTSAAAASDAGGLCPRSRPRGPDGIGGGLGAGCIRAWRRERTRRSCLSFPTGTSARRPGGRWALHR